MDDSFGDGDDLMWDGLACPPLEDYAFNFDNSFTPDDMLDDLLLEINQEDDQEGDDYVGATSNKSGENSGTRIMGKPSIRTRSCGKGKEINILGQVLVLQVERHSKTFYGFDPKHQPVKDVVVADNKRKADHDLRFEGRVIKKHVQGSMICDQPNHPSRRYGNHGKGKELNIAIPALNLSEAEIKAFLGETEGVVEKKDRKRELLDCCSRLDNRNQLAVVNNKRTTFDYGSRFEASRQKLHEKYEQCREAKRQKQIQVIDFRKPVTEQPRCNAKSKGKPSLRQKLMAMGTRKRNKRFPSFITLSSCIQ